MKKEKIKIKDESGDRKYFTQIPNMIVNHSTAYEQSLYLIMKRIAGEDGSCYASINFLYQKMGVAKRTVTETIEKLLKRKWIAEIENKKVQGGKTRQFVIVDLWRLNLEEYESGTHVSTSSKKEVEPQIPEVEPQSTRSGTHVHTKKNLEEEQKKKDKQSMTIAGAGVNEAISLFKEMTTKNLYELPPQRFAISRLLEKYGIEKVKIMVAAAQMANAAPYSGLSITTPYELENKLDKLRTFVMKEKNKSKTKKVFVI